MAKCKKLNLFMDSVVYALLLLSDGRSSVSCAVSSRRGVGGALKVSRVRDFFCYQNKSLHSASGMTMAPLFYLMTMSSQCSGSESGSGSTGFPCFWASRIRIHQLEVWIRIRIHQLEVWIRIRILLPQKQKL